VLEAIGKIADVGTVSFLLRIITDGEKLNLTALRALVRIAEASKPQDRGAGGAALIQSRSASRSPREDRAAHRASATTPKREVKAFILKFLGWSRRRRARCRC
jgi:hypothetical protein